MTQRKVKARAKFATALESLDKINDKECVKLTFDLAPGHEEKYETMPWTGWLHSDEAIEITLGALRNCGWEGDLINDLTGIDKNDVMLVLEDEEYQGKSYTKVKFVNRIAGFTAKNPLNAAQSSALAHRLRSKAAAHKQTYSAAGAKTEQKSQATPNTRAPATNGGAAPWDEDAPFPG